MALSGEGARCRWLAVSSEVHRPLWGKGGTGRQRAVWTGTQEDGVRVRGDTMTLHFDVYCYTSAFLDNLHPLKKSSVRKPPILSPCPTLATLARPMSHAHHTHDQRQGPRGEPRCPPSRQRALFHVLAAYSVYNAESTVPGRAVPRWPGSLSGLSAASGDASSMATEVMRGELCSHTEMDGRGAGQKWHLWPGLCQPLSVEMFYKNFTWA